MTSHFIRLLARLGPIALNTSAKQRLSILIYHRVVSQPDPMRPGEPTLDEFSWQMELLKRNFSVLPLAEASQRLRENTLPPRAVCVTFDDGYSDNESLALSVLKKFSIPATVFVSTGFLNGGRMWNDSVIEAVRQHRGSTLDLRDVGLESYPVDTPLDRFNTADAILTAIKHKAPEERSAIVGAFEGRSSNLPDDLMMTDAQVLNLANSGIDIGAHTVNHPILSRVTDEVAYSEIADSKAYLENLIQKDVLGFAYPNGRPDADYKVKHRDLVEKLGFNVAVSTHWGVSTRESDPYQLPRFTPWDRTEFRFAARLLLNTRRVDPLLAD
jgi:peptidoglycan/xylan/chitin deacetylase (PgdA/CDA1 family)